MDQAPKICPGCKEQLPVESPAALCPRCLKSVETVPHPGSAAQEMGRLDSGQLVKLFPQLEIGPFIGRGGMGLVYKARQILLDRHVALKLVPHSPGTNSLLAERFYREGRILAKLQHPGIVSIYDLGLVEGFFFLLMEFVDGLNLRQAMQAGRISPVLALDIVPRICEALQYAHEQGVLHRDIKPENILIDAAGRVKIADFGIAKLMEDDQKINTLTRTDQTLGTPHYMAPEQLEKSAGVDHRADIYSLGVVFYEMLTGELPVGRFAPPSARTPIDRRIDQIVLRALEKERELRPKTAREMKAEIESINSGQPAPARSRPNRHTDISRPLAVQDNPTHPLRSAPLISRRTIGISLLGLIVLVSLFIVRPAVKDPKTVPIKASPSPVTVTPRTREEAFNRVIAQAQLNLKEVQKDYAAGLVSTGEVAKAMLELAIARARDDRIAYFKAHLDYSEWLLRNARQDGKPEDMWKAELMQADARRGIATVEAQGDRLKVARADLQFAQSLFEVAQKKFEAGVIDQKRLRRAEKDVAQIRLLIKELLEAQKQ